METAIMGYVYIYWSYTGTMEKKMETTILNQGSKGIEFRHTLKSSPPPSRLLLMDL